MKKEEIRRLFEQGIDCSQVVAGAFADEAGYSVEEMRRMSACFGGGMFCGETCGAVTGALMVLGLKHGHFQEGDTQQKMKMTEKLGEFNDLFAQKYPSCICRDLLGHDISKQGEFEKAAEEGLLLNFCPQVVEHTIQILEKIL